VSDDDLTPIHLDPPFAVVSVEKLERGEVVIPIPTRADYVHGYQWGYEGKGPFYVVDKVVVDENRGSAIYKHALDPGVELDPDVEEFWDESDDTYTVWVRRILNPDAWRRKGMQAKFVDGQIKLFESVDAGQAVALIIGDTEPPVPI